MAPTATIEHDHAAAPPTAPVAVSTSRRGRGGLVLLAFGAAALAVWFAWRLSHPLWHPLAVLFLGAELSGAVAAVIVGVGLAGASSPRDIHVDEPRDSHWYAHAVADLVGRTRAADIHRDVRTAVRAAPRWRWRDRADATVAAILLDGPRRLVMLLVVVVGLLFGATPFRTPPWWAVVALVVGSAAIGLAHVSLGQGRLRPGDRIRWSYGAIGEVVARVDVAGVAPRRWIGSVAAVVVLSIAIALRGMSDRWTHGLRPMPDADRVVLLLVAVLLVLGALYTLATSPRPTQADAHLLARHLDEGTARQSLLAAAVCVGTIGLIAGVLPTEHTAVEPPHRTVIATPELP